MAAWSTVLTGIAPVRLLPSKWGGGVDIRVKAILNKIKGGIKDEAVHLRN